MGDSLEQRLEGEFGGRLQALEQVLEDELFLEQHLGQGDNSTDTAVEALKFIGQVQHLPLLQRQVEVGLVLGGLILADVVDVVEDAATDIDLLNALRELFELKWG